GKSLTFKSLPEPPEEPLDERADAFALALEQARATDEAYRAATAVLGEDAESLAALAAAERARKDREREELGAPPRDRAQPTHADMARAVGLNPDYDLPRPNGMIASHHHDAYLQTLLFPEEMERKLRGLLSSYRTFLQELGINT